MILSKTIFKRFYFILFVINYGFQVQGQQKIIDDNVIEVVIPSKKMNKSHKALVFLPEDYQKNTKHYPVVYLLHGYSGNYLNWYKREPRLKEYATQYNMIIVTPEGNYDSWYIDSPIDKTSQYESYIGLEVPRWIDTHFRTRSSFRQRAISGLSMGGNGALCIATDYPGIFGAASGISSPVDLRKYPDKWNLKKIIGDIYKYPMYWFKSSFAGKALMIQKNYRQAFLLDCGVDDTFYEDNEKMHKQLLSFGIKHDFFIRPGGHSWDYWRNALPYHLLFFKNFFEKKQ